MCPRQQLTVRSALVVAKLAELAGALWTTGYDSEELYRTRAELADREATLALVDAQLTAELLKPGGGSAAIIGSFRDALDKLEAEVARLRWQKEMQSLPEALRPFADCKDDPEVIAKVWDQLPLEGKRSVLRILAESITLSPARHAGRGQQPVAERITVTWKPLYVVSAEGSAATDGGERITEVRE